MTRLKLALFSPSPLVPLTLRLCYAIPKEGEKLKKWGFDEPCSSNPHFFFHSPPQEWGGARGGVDNLDFGKALAEMQIVTRISLQIA